MGYPRWRSRSPRTWRQRWTQHGLVAPRLHHGYGLATWPVLRAAIRMGRDIRIGLEDTTVLADGRVASGNGELVEAAVRLAAELSRPS